MGNEKIYTQNEFAEMQAKERERYRCEIEKIHAQYRDINGKYHAAIQLLNKLLESEVEKYA